MASIDMRTTKSDHHPVKHGSDANDSIATTGNQNTQINTPANGLPISNGCYYCPCPPQFFVQFPYTNYYQDAKFAPFINTVQSTALPSSHDQLAQFPGDTGSQSKFPAMNEGTNRGHPNPFPPFQMSPGSRSQIQVPLRYAFSGLHDPNAAFTLSIVFDSRDYKDWVYEFSEILRKQGLDKNLPKRRNGYRKWLTEEEETYIANIHMACVPNTSYPKWFKKSLEKTQDFMDCFLEAVGIVSEENGKLTLMCKICKLSLRDRESVENFLQRTTRLYQRAERAKLHDLDELIIPKVLQALPDEYIATELVFNTQEDQSFDALMELLLSGQWVMKGTKGSERKNNKHQGKQWNNSSNERKQKINRFNNSNQYTSKERKQQRNNTTQFVKNCFCEYPILPKGLV